MNAPERNESLISFEHVSKSFGGTMILNDLNLFIPLVSLDEVVQEKVQ